MVPVLSTNLEQILASIAFGPTYEGHVGGTIHIILKATNLFRSRACLQVLERVHRDQQVLPPMDSYFPLSVVF